MPTAKWANPVEVGFAQDGPQMVQGPFDALTCLMDTWPDVRGPQYVAARSFCRAALDGRKSAEEAREVFISAAREAKLQAH
ncbi:MULTISPECIES: DUF982 domain-containing protein [unclassified Rhizobium]|uniref:DUF982 domain-containing protein n=1 Tax=unclassified Rhizobium TaxID=2613769 RepID=UPI00071331D4|nr:MULTISPECIES: DUF982 domain-containing protein [unclassified Rhizobium]KQS98074.1 hypothetical protein ASG50_23110 [Rhizobium sp. Leaf386]KQT00335.1 hypothetical protein ASG42_05700 [Rhizobium sp. Leaf391]KQT97338.1 hypothetical protein ASG68_10430 [Rhizobium sp. Leaf453]